MEEIQQEKLDHVAEVEMETENEETHSSKKLEKTDIETVIKAEMKDLAMAKVFQKLDLKSMTAERNNLKKEMVFFDNKTEELNNEIILLKQNVNVANKDLQQWEQNLEKLDKVINLMNVKGEKLESICKQSSIHQIYELVLNLEEEIAKFKTHSVEEIKTEENKLLALEIEGKQKISLLEDEIKKLSKFFDELEYKVEEIEDIGKVLAKYLEEFSSKIEATTIQEEIDDIVTSNAACLEKIDKVKIIYDQLMENLHNTKKNRLNSLKIFQDDFRKMYTELQKKFSCTTSCINDEQIQILNSFSDDFMKSYHEKWVVVQKKYELQKKYHQQEIRLIEKQKSNEILRTKMNELLKQHKAAHERISLLESSKEKYKQKMEVKLKTQQEEYQAKVALHDREMEQLEKRKEHASASLNLLQGTFDALKKNSCEIELNEKQRKVVVTKFLLEDKKNEAEKFTKKVELLKEETSKITKADPKSPSKKVRFNEVPSIKSPTSSEDTWNLAKTANKNLDTSLHDWIYNLVEEEEV